VADEEDVALSAFHSFCRGAEQGHFSRLENRDDLWQILGMLASRKAANLARYELRPKRYPGRVQSLDTPSANEADESSGCADPIGKEPDPALAAQVAEEVERLLVLLDNEELRRVAQLKMDGFTNQEIAEELDRRLCAIERKLRRIRHIWQNQAAQG
jgi:DNA-directed RNA polymerase specialized sigma24 family protein